MPHDNNSLASARIDMGDGFSTGLHLTPCAAPVTAPGEVTLVLGALPSGRPLTVVITSTAWLEDLADAVRVLRDSAALAMPELAVTP
jgi:hypothetical protein